MTESKIINISLDENSIRILSKADKIHRDSMVNVGIALLEKTGYYKTLTGTTTLSIEETASLDTISVEKTPIKKEANETKKATSWDSF